MIKKKELDRIELYKKYKIVFIDPTGDTGWCDEKEFENFNPDHCVIEGYVFSKNNKFVRTFASYSVDEHFRITSFGDRNVLPTNCIVKMILINGEKK
jgi:hypothetical protein